MCEIYKPEKFVYNSKDFSVADEVDPKYYNQNSNQGGLEQARDIYKENMGNIYKCAIIQSQKNAYKNIKEFIGMENSGNITEALGTQIDSKTRRLDVTAASLGCTLSDDKSVYNKLNILNETSYQACKYINYLEYLREYYEKTGNSFSPQEQDRLSNNENSYSPSYTAQEIANSMKKQQNAVAEEISHTYKVFPLAFEAYSEYEDNFPIHFLLQMILADYIALRDALHSNLNPIAQFGLKIINAMSY